MIKAIGKLNGTTKSSSLNLIYFKAYWANLNGEKIDKTFFNSIVRLYIERFWVYNIKLKFYIEIGDNQISFLEKTLKEIQPLYFTKKENFIEIDIGKIVQLREVSKDSNISIGCSVIEGFGYYYKTEVAKLKVEYYYLYVIRQWEYKKGPHANQATISTFYIEGTDIKGYILEPIGESTTTSGLDQRIPVGKYNLQWHVSKKYNKGKYKDKYLKYGFPKLYNEKVPASRAILIHRGNSGAHSLGCLLSGTGKNLNNSQVTGSTNAFNRIIDFIENVGIEYVKVVISEKIK